MNRVPNSRRKSYQSPESQIRETEEIGPLSRQICRRIGRCRSHLSSQPQQWPLEASCEYSCVGDAFHVTLRSHITIRIRTWHLFASSVPELGYPLSNSRSDSGSGRFRPHIQLEWVLFLIEGAVFPPCFSAPALATGPVRYCMYFCAHPIFPYHACFPFRISTTRFNHNKAS